MNYLKRKIKSSVFWVIVFFVGLFLLSEAVKFQVMLSDLDDDTISEYCGYYTVCEKGPREYNKRYIVELGNGDKLEIPNIYVDYDKIFEKGNMATFRYSRQKFVSIFGLHSQGISITSVDKTIVYLDENTATDDAKGKMIILYFGSFFTFCVALLPIWLAMVFQIIIRTKKPKRKLKQKRKKERRKRQGTVLRLNSTGDGVVCSSKNQNPMG